jgi:hypothetical protein
MSQYPLETGLPPVNNRSWRLGDCQNRGTVPGSRSLRHFERAAVYYNQTRPVASILNI